MRMLKNKQPYKNFAVFFLNFKSRTIWSTNKEDNESDQMFDAVFGTFQFSINGAWDSFWSGLEMYWDPISYIRSQAEIVDTFAREIRKTIQALHQSSHFVGVQILLQAVNM